MLRKTCCVDIRALVIEKLTSTGRSRYWLAERLHSDGVCARNTIYRWLAGEGDVMTRVAGAALEALDLTLDDPKAIWGTVRIDQTVVACRVGSAQWLQGSWRQIEASRESAEKSRSQRLDYLTRASR
jgi:hypothetical protein